ncbi:MAG TPA: ATP-binding protein [Solirubrobacterales bacterium]|nr:ATP-binding protein [Solirubrobacterales bacterium]
MAKNPYRPGVGTRPPYLAGREQEIHLFERLLEDYPEKRRNLRITGLRGVGKTVLLKEYERIAKSHKWVVVRRDWGPRLREESDFAIAIVDYLREALEALSVKAKIKNQIAAAMQTINQVQIQLADDVAVSVGPGAGSSAESVLEDKLRIALTKVGEIARAQGRGVALMFDEAHSVYDRGAKRQYPLGALLSAIVAAQDDDDNPLPVMLVLCGLPPLIGNIHAARSNAERLFRAEELDNLSLGPESQGELSAAAEALVRPTSDIAYASGVAEQIARDVDGYPYFIQWFGEALWDAADLEGTTTITSALYKRERKAIQHSLDDEFFEPRYRDARQADQGTLRVAASLGGERFNRADLDAATHRSTGALAQSLTRLIADNLIYRDDHGVYAYTAPLFGDFMRRRHERHDEDG